NRFLASFVGIVLFVSAFLGTTLAATPVQASDITYEILRGIPVLPHCPNPGGELIASHNEGFHQIPGNGLLEGSDRVYRVGDKLFVQCYCPPEESGITTGIEAQWIHESYLTPEQEQFIQSLGWLRIENGEEWNLPAGTCFVNNSFFKCKKDQACPIDDKKDKTALKKEKVEEKIAEKREQLEQKLEERKERLQERLDNKLSWQR
ncbi:hypothetical protein KKA69_03615, partial [Patescibacteria group bacterium]|nr:hypothetical protein [Patescibacteria group bacterium]